MRHQSAVTIALIVILCACSSNTLQVNYLCDPSGAGLYEENVKKLGTCPAAVEYPITKEDKARGYMLLKGVTAFWVSGVSSSVPRIKADLKNGTSQQFQFDRPRDVPGYSTDATYALELRRNQILKEQEEDQAYANFLRALAASAAQSSVQTPAQRSLHCTSTPSFGTVYTNCY